MEETKVLTLKSLEKQVKEQLDKIYEILEDHGKKIDIIESASRR